MYDPPGCAFSHSSQILKFLRGRSRNTSLTFWWRWRWRGEKKPKYRSELRLPTALQTPRIMAPIHCFEVKAFKQGETNTTTTRLSRLGASVLSPTGSNSVFCSMKRLGILLLPPDGMQIHRWLPVSILWGYPNKWPVPIYTPVLCLA